MPLPAILRCWFAAALLMTGCGIAGQAVTTGDEQPASATGTDSAGADSEASGDIVDYEVVVVATHPHDPDAYTQGLEFVDGLLLESTGLTEESSIRLVEPETGVVLQRAQVAGELFAEGATVVGRRVLQLTWKDEVLLVRSLDDLEEVGRIGYSGEGWGLCATDAHVVMSNGTDQLALRDRDTFERISTVTVTERTEPLIEINELECVGDLVWANIWQQDRIVAIDPTTGTVVGTADLSALVPDGVLDADSDNVLNGIAYHPDTGRFWVTGKRWPVMYELELRASP